MSQERRLIQLLKQQINVERDDVKNITEASKTVNSAAARLLLLEMRLDSEKHARMLAEMLKILKKLPQDTSLWEHKLEEYVGEALARKEFEEQLATESSVLTELKEESKHTKDTSLKLLLQNIEEDDAKHDRMIETMIHNLYKKD